ncbi:MAG: DUF3611 family protein [Leptolyngbyaceae cyanobacterium bins.349]|nr:DUF3611 family protein [Leptolyngbyaceae cyanobacterium bins.349]
MQTELENLLPSTHLERVAAVLRIAGWASFAMQIGLAATTGVFLLLAVSGRNFNQAIAPTPGIPGAVVTTTQATTPGLGIGIFWAVCGLLVLLFGIYLAFRLIRFSKRLRHPDPVMHPQRGKVMEVLRLAVMVGLAGMVLTLLGSGATIGVLLAKSVAQPQGVAIYDPNRIIRSLDVFVAAANTTGVTAHFVGAVTALGIFNWLHRPSDPV